MKALAFNEHGGLDKLRYQDVPDPEIGPGDVLVRVRACALNHLDLFVREGLPGFKLPLPFWSGCDIAGDVAQVGAAAEGVAVGDRVAVNPNLHCGRCEFVTCGGTSGPICETDVRQVFWKQVSIIGSTMSNNAEFHDVMTQLFRGRLRAIVDSVMPLTDGALAQRRLAEGKQFGKIVLIP
jgi:NADPH:quinone reductase-like Zn-dependent oxidoreductase